MPVNVDPSVGREHDILDVYKTLEVAMEGYRTLCTMMVWYTDAVHVIGVLMHTLCVACRTRCAGGNVHIHRP